MKVISLQAENFKRLRAVEIQANGAPVVVVAGANAQGKSSVLDSIWAALAGRGYVVDQPVHAGAEQAVVRVDLGEIVVTKAWDAATGKGTLTVTSKAGARFPSPQKMLDELVGKLSFDPLAFAQADEKTQLTTLLKVVDVGFDPASMAEERRGLYDERTVVNREVKRLEAAASEMPAGGHVEPVDIGDTLQQLQDAEAHGRCLADCVERYQATAARIADLTEQLAQAQATLELLAKTGRTLQETAVDPQPLRERLARAAEINQQAQLAAQRDVILRQLGERKERSALLSQGIEQLDTTKAQLIAAAQMPVEGLGFDENGVLLNGVPFSQASAAERLRTSVAMAMAMNPEIRVVRITDGSLLDSRNMAVIEQMAVEKDFQVWIERVDESGAVGVTIEDGAVVPAQNGVVK